MTITDNADDSFPQAPAVMIFAGPNGSGKSTILSQSLADAGLAPVAYINADDIAKTLEAEIPDYRERNLRAAQFAEQRRKDALERGEDFAFETVMSTPEKVALFTQAKARGYEVMLIFVSTNDPAINVQRVANRVALGGHAVAEDAIRERYRRALDLLACAVEHADAAVVYDNSLPNAEGGPLQVAIKSEGRVTITGYDDFDTAWVESALRQPWIARTASRSHVNALMEQDAAVRGLVCPPDPVAAIAKHEADYWGIAIAVTDHHFLLLSPKGEYTIHDRQLTATSDVAEGKWCCVQYRYAPGGKIDRSNLIESAAKDPGLGNAPTPRRGPSP